jgi:leucine-zipper of insertion element IS481
VKSSSWSTVMSPLTESGRLRLARYVVEDGRPLRRTAERFQVSHITAHHWACRLAPSERAVFAQVAVDRKTSEIAGACGSMLSSCGNLRTSKVGYRL